MKHIAFLTLSMSRGGAERVIANMCNEFLVDRYQITIITCMNRPLEYTLDDKIQVVTVDRNAEEAKQNMAVRFLRRRNRLIKILGEVSPDILLCFLPEPNMLGCSLKLAGGLRNSLSMPIVISVRNDPVREYAGKVRNMMMKFLYPKADGYVFQTQEAMDYFVFNKHIMEEGRVIPNPISRNFLVGSKAKERAHKVVAVGSLTPQKNQAMLIDAFAQIHAAFPEYTLEICGEGALREKLQEQIDHLGLEKSVTLAGNVENVKDKIQDAALFVMPSDFEGMPNALMEAMALGIPVISTDCPCGGPRFLIQDGVNGRLIPVGDSKRLSEVMSDMLSHPKEAEEMADDGMKVRDKLNPEVINQTWEACIQKYVTNGID